MALHLKTFADIVAAVREELKVQSTDTVAINRIKRDVNMTYSEIVSSKEWWWLIESVTLKIPAYYNKGTAFVLHNNSTVMLSQPIGASKKGYYFSVDGQNNAYRIESHVAGTNVLKLSETYIGPSNKIMSFKIWTDTIPLPTNLKATISVMPGTSNQVLENMGHHDFRRFSANLTKFTGVPEAYYTSDFVDPFPTYAIEGLPGLLTRKSDGVVKTLVFKDTLPASLVDNEQIKVTGSHHPSYNGVNFVAQKTTTFKANDTLIYTGKEEHTELALPDDSLKVEFAAPTKNRARYRAMYVYPALTQREIPLLVDYQKQVAPLDKDTDEPIIPVDDRIVMVYAALHRAWSRERNPEEAQRNYTLYNEKLSRMAAEIQDSLDKPLLRPSRLYLGSKRNRFRTRSFNFGYTGNFELTGPANGDSNMPILGLPNSVAIYNNDGELDTSSVVSTTELNYLDGVSSSIQTQIDTINAYLSTAFVTDALVSPTAAIARSKLAAGTPNAIVANDASGVMISSGVTVSELSFLTGVTPLTSVLLADNQAVPATVFTLPTTNTYCYVLYSIKRGNSVEGGVMVLLNDGVVTDLVIDSSSIGDVGMTLTADVVGANVRLRYTSTGTGITPTFKYAVIKWAA